MECNHCGHSNAPAKRSCERCFKILTGYTCNNVTGEFGYRNSDGSFTKEPKSIKDIKEDKPEHIPFTEIIYAKSEEILEIQKRRPKALIYVIF